MDKELILPGIPESALSQYTIFRVKPEDCLKFFAYIIPFIAAMLNEDFKGKIIEDDGIGAGILSLVALQGGAKRVVGIEYGKDELKKAGELFRQAGYNVKHLKANEWKFYESQGDDQVILIEDNLVAWYAAAPEIRERVAGGSLDTRLAELGPMYTGVFIPLLLDVLKNYTNKTILGGYIDGSGKNLRMDSAETVGILKHNEAQHTFSAYVREDGSVFTALTVQPKASSAARKEPIGIDPSLRSGSIPESEVGGIDFRALPAVTQPILTLPGQSPMRTVPVMPLAELNNEWRQIENMINAGIIPSPDRINEYLQACCQKQEFNQDIDKALSCIADILRLEEERVAVTDASLKEILALLESDKPASEMQFALGRITVEAKEPKVLEQ